MKTSLIIFSKNRTLQLKSLILSLLHHTEIPENAINVIYKVDIPQITYAPLLQDFKEINFVKEGDFLADIKKIVADSESDYFIFMVDDLIVRDAFSLAYMESFLDTHRNVGSFCLRMGRNIKRGNTPEFTEYDNDILVWETSNKLGQHWNYQWEVSSSLYRRPLVQEYLSKCRHDKETFPNPFEDHYYSCMPSTYQLPPLITFINAVRFIFRKKSMHIACFKESKCFTQAVNVVADIEDDYKRRFDPLTLHEKMMEGYVLDLEPLKNVLPDQPNVGAKAFKLKKT